MNANRLRIYYFTVVGAIAGLLAWYIYILLDQNYQLHVGEQKKLLEAAIMGGLLGFFLGFLINSIDGVLLGSRQRLIKGGFLGAISGTIGGVVGLVLTVGLYQEFIEKLSASGANGSGISATGMTIIIFSWTFFGVLLGLANGLVGDTRPIKAVIGGAIGGLSGGLVYTFIGAKSFENGLMITLILIGVLIAIAISIAASLQDAWLEVVEFGVLKGKRSFDLSKAVRQPGVSLILGSGKGANLPIAKDPKVSQTHASLTREGENFILKRLDGEVYVHGRAVSNHRLKNGDPIRIGNTNLIYCEKRTTPTKARKRTIRFYD